MRGSLSKGELVTPSQYVVTLTRSDGSLAGYLPPLGATHLASTVAEARKFTTAADAAVATCDDHPEWDGLARGVAVLPHAWEAEGASERQPEPTRWDGDEVGRFRADADLETVRQEMEAVIERARGDMRNEARDARLAAWRALAMVDKVDRLRAVEERAERAEAERDAYLAYAAYAVRSYYHDWSPERAIDHVCRMSRALDFVHLPLAQCRAAVQAMREQHREASQ
jgi:hypothetical protein